MEDVDALNRFAMDRRGSREALQRFLATDKESLEHTLIVAATVPVAHDVSTRFKSEGQIAIPAAVGPDSPGSSD